MIERLKRVHADHLVRWAADKPEVLVLSADLTGSCEADAFRDAYPERFYSMGIAEQNMLGFAGGLAREGFLPLVHTFAVFLYRRAYDQIAMSIAYPNLPVVLLGFLPGVYTPGGATHQAIEDIGVMRSLPNMAVLETGDATEVESVLDVAAGVHGPVYIRMIRGEIPRLFGDPMRFGRARNLSHGGDLVLVTTGICTEEALRAARVFEKNGIGVEHFHLSTIKPFDYPEILEKIAASRCGVITMENHSILGGVGSFVAEAMAERGIGKRLIRIGFRDTFLHGASRGYLMHEYKIDAFELIARTEELCGEKIAFEEADLEEAFVPPMHSDAKPEAL